MAERNDPRGYNNPVHLMMLGRPGAGKTTLINTILYGNSRGHPGPNAGTINFDNSPNAIVMINGVEYIVHDTPGIDVNADVPSFINDDIHENLLNKRCIVVLCIRWDDRILDADRQVLQVVNSISNDIWNKVIIALTHSDVLPDGTNVGVFNTQWHEAIKENIRRLGVSDDTLMQLNICNTSMTNKTCCFSDWLTRFIIKFACILSVEVSNQIVSSYEKCVSSYEKTIPALVGACSGIAIKAFFVNGALTSLTSIISFVGCTLGGIVVGIIVVAAYFKFYQ